MLSPQVQAVKIIIFCDAAHEPDIIRMSSTIEIIFLLFNTPIPSYAKQQHTIEWSTFGFEFVTLRISAELSEILQFKLRMFGLISFVHLFPRHCIFFPLFCLIPI